MLCMCVVLDVQNMCVIAHTCVWCVLFRGIYACFRCHAVTVWGVCMSIQCMCMLVDVQIILHL